ncbi:MAG: enoyl-CoA hydratase/isomerase family protein [Myxococcales bacterium]|nr:enoyl-CoA hydratase/isomerase family protein [Myxococcales bacterium]HRC57953.1 enoyl-CoA hydratase-related protein [Kofleriaceae bacterium]
MSEFLQVDRRDDGVVWVTLNRPEARNALSMALNLELYDLGAELEGDSDLRLVVITGAGDKAFSAGADLKERKGVSASETGPYVNAIGNAINQWSKIRALTVALMNGSAFGGGLELALACDLRILVEGAELGLTEVRLGIMPGAGGTVRLPRLIGEARAKEMILLGRRISAQRAYEIGLVNAVVPRERLAAEMESLLAELAGCAPLSVRAAKTSVERALEVGVEEGLTIEGQCYETTLYSDDRNEGLAAFAEGRKPQYSGR